MSQCERCADLERQLAERTEELETWASAFRRTEAQRDAALKRLREVADERVSTSTTAVGFRIGQLLKHRFGPTLTDGLEESPATPATDESTSTGDRSRRDSPKV
jgi:hypothetical protein